MNSIDYESFCCSSADAKENKITPVKAAKQALELIKKYSQHFEQDAYGKLIRFDLKELILGEPLGEGSYNIVYEIRSIKIQHFIEDDKNLESFSDSMLCDHCELQKRKLFMASKCLRSENYARYAMKYLKSETMNANFFRYQQGAVDIVRETAILSSLSHPNIIKLRGLSSNCISGYVINPAKEI